MNVRMQMEQDGRFRILPDEMDALFLYHDITGYSFETIKLGRILRYKDKRLVPITRTINYAYLENPNNPELRRRYVEYCSEWSNLKDNPDRSEETYADLMQRIIDQKYDPRVSAIVINQYNCIVDGLHRSCILTKKYGPEHQVDVVRIKYDVGIRIKLLYPLYRMNEKLTHMRIDRYHAIQE